MQVKISETGEVKSLAIYADGIEFTVDFCDLGTRLWDDEEQEYSCSSSEFDFWQELIAKHQVVNDRIDELSSMHGKAAVYAAIGDAGCCDVGDEPAAITNALDEAFGE